MNARIAVAAGIAVVLAAVFTMPQAAFAADVNVDITTGSSTKTDDAYAPNPVEVNVGDKVIWTNKDSTIHTATAGTAADGPTGMFGGTLEAPGLIAPTRTQEFVFNEAGDFPYYCILHPTMVGTVKVAGGGTGPQTSTATATIDGNSYTVTASSATAKITEAEIEPAEKKVTLVFDAAGEAEVTLPKTMIDGVVAGAGIEIVETTAEATKVKVTIPAGEPEVDIMGSFVVPEFPVIAALVLAITVAGVVVYTRFAKQGAAGFFGRA
jgi:plastocyanin